MHSSSTISSRRVLTPPSLTPSRRVSYRGTARCECSNRRLSNASTPTRRRGVLPSSLRTRREVGGCREGGRGRVSWLIPLRNAGALDGRDDAARAGPRWDEALATTEIAFLVGLRRSHHRVCEGDAVGVGDVRGLRVFAVEVFVSLVSFEVADEIHGRCLLGGASFSSVWKVHRPRRSLAVRSRGRFRQYRDLSPTRFRGTER